MGSVNTDHMENSILAQLVYDLRVELVVHLFEHTKVNVSIAQLENFMILILKVELLLEIPPQQSSSTLLKQEINLTVEDLITMSTLIVLKLWN